MQLVAVNLQPSGGATSVITGNFSSEFYIDTLVAHGTHITLYSPDGQWDSDVGAYLQVPLRAICTENIYGTVRGLAVFRAGDSGLDDIALTTESGRISVLRYHAERKEFIKILQETFGKEGARRTVPGQYLSADPRGRALFISSVESRSFAYSLSPGPSSELTISNPIEAHLPNVLIFQTLALDTGFENPQFALLTASLKHTINDQPSNVKHLVILELAMGMNIVVCKEENPLSETAHHILPINISGAESDRRHFGVLVCHGQYIEFRDLERNHKTTCAYPRRLWVSAEENTFIVASAKFERHGGFLMYIQNDYGDIFQVRIAGVAENCVLTCSYVVTLPRAIALRILSTGHMLAILEFGEIRTYEILSRDTDDALTACSNHEQGIAALVGFVPVGKGKYLELVDKISSLCPLIRLKALDLACEKKAQLYALQGGAEKSALKVLRHGLPLQQIGDCNVGGVPTAVFPLKDFSGSPYHSLALISFLNRTVPLKIGEYMEEDQDSGFLTNTVTLAAGVLSNDSLVQVHPGGVLHLSDKSTARWNPSCPVKLGVVVGQHVVMVLERGDICILILTAQGQLTEGKSYKSAPTAVPVALSMMPLLPGELRSWGFCVACSDNTITFFEFVDDSVICFKSRIVVDDAVHSIQLTRGVFKPLCVRQGWAGLDRAANHAEGIVPSRDDILSTSGSTGANPKGVSTGRNPLMVDTGAMVNERPVQTNLPTDAPIEEYVDCHIHVGMTNGTYKQGRVDSATGAVTWVTDDIFLGPKAVSVSLMNFFDSTSVLVHGITAHLYIHSRSREQSSTPGANFHFARALLANVTNSSADSFVAVPLMFHHPLDELVPFSSPQFPGCGCIARRGRTLYVLQLDFRAQLRHGPWNCSKLPLHFTPRDFVALPPDPSVTSNPNEPNHLAIIESDHRTHNLHTQRELRSHISNLIQGQEWQETEEEFEETEGNPEYTAEVQANIATGGIRAGNLKWGGALRIVNAKTLRTVAHHIFAVNESPTALSVQYFQHQRAPRIIVGTSIGTDLATGIAKETYIRVFAYSDTYAITELITCNIDGASIPRAFISCEGVLIAAVGRSVRVLQIGKKQLLRKNELELSDCNISCMVSRSNRIFVGTVREGVRVLQFRPKKQQLVKVADDFVPRWCTAMALLDVHTVAVSDKFDQVAILRVPRSAASATSTCTKLQHIANYHFGEMITSIQKATLTVGGSELLLLGSLQGGIHILLPLESDEQNRMLSDLECALRTHLNSVGGNSHIVYRSTYTPVRNVIDGNLLLEFHTLTQSTKDIIAETLFATIPDIERVLDSLRQQII